MKDCKRYEGKINVESIFSPDGKEHRYVLRRKYETDRSMLESKKLVFLLINPSFADELLFDKTNRLASNIGIRDGFNEVVIVNMFSLITTSIAQLNKELKNANGSFNDIFLEKEFSNANKLIISWGIQKKYDLRRKDIKEIIQKSGLDQSNIFCIKYTDKNGKVYQPAHLSMYINDNPVNFELINDF